MESTSEWQTAEIGTSEIATSNNAMMLDYTPGEDQKCQLNFSSLPAKTVEKDVSGYANLISKTKFLAFQHKFHAPRIKISLSNERGHGNRRFKKKKKNIRNIRQVKKKNY